MRSPTGYCWNTFWSASHASRSTTGGERTAFNESKMVQDAVVRNLQTLAESTQRISLPLRNTEQGVPWRAIAGFRNVLTHGYLDIDPEVVWSVVEQELPELAAAVERMLRSSED